MRIPFIKQYLVYGCLSFVMICLAILSLKKIIPWVDEVMFADTPMHYMKGLGWTTFAWYSVAKQDPFLLYPPLYSMIMVIWMNFFGTTLIACRSLNLIIIMIIGMGILRICRQLGQKISLIQIGLLIMLLWCTDDMIYMYSNGRPDLLGAAILVFIVSEIICLTKDNKKGWQLVMLSAFLIATGIQAVAYLYSILLLAYLTFTAYRKRIKKIAVLLVSGTLLGFMLVCAFMAYHGHLVAFVVNILSYSNTIMNFAMISLPIFGEYTGIDITLYMEKIANNTTDVTFLSRILEIYKHPTYVSLLVTALLIIFLEHRNLKDNSLYAIINFLFVIALLIPLLMNILGRFPDYYYWMVYIPIFILMIIFIEFRRYHLIIGLVILFLVIQGLNTSYQHHSYSEIETFMKKCSMLNNKSVVAPFSVFYEIEKISSHTYYLGVYPFRYLPNDIDYLILPPKESGYGVNQLYDYYDSICKSDSLQTIMVAESKTAGLKVFKLIHNKQFPNNN